jgi:glutaredoxin
MDYKSEYEKYYKKYKKLKKIFSNYYIVTLYTNDKCPYCTEFKDTWTKLKLSNINVLFKTVSNHSGSKIPKLTIENGGKVISVYSNTNRSYDNIVYWIMENIGKK